jgi:hypothetical protein
MYLIYCRYLDDLPVMTSREGSSIKQAGFRLGYFDREHDKAFLNNHVSIKAFYHLVDDDKKVVVGFHIDPMSVAKVTENCTLGENETKPLEIKEGEELFYTYSVEWREDVSITWKQRWDLYLLRPKEGIYYMSLVNSTVIFLGLSVATAVILMRLLKPETKDKEQNDLDDIEEWRDLGGDVFRPPSKHSILVPLIGAGIQLFFTTELLIGKTHRKENIDELHYFFSWLMNEYIFTVIGARGWLNPPYSGRWISLPFFFYGLAS